MGDWLRHQQLSGPGCEKQLAFPRHLARGGAVRHMCFWRACQGGALAYCPLLHIQCETSGLINLMNIAKMQPNAMFVHAFPSHCDRGVHVSAVGVTLSRCCGRCLCCAGGSFLWYLQRLAAAVSELHSKYDSQVCLVSWGLRVGRSSMSQWLYSSLLVRDGNVYSWLF